MPSPRKPGSQVAPNQKPYVRPPPKSRAADLKPVPGMAYRVRDRNEGDVLGTVWGENLSWEEAHTLKDKVLGSRKSTTARVEPMNVPLVTAEAVAEGVDLGDLDDASAVAEADSPAPVDVSLHAGEPLVGTPFDIADDQPHEIPCAGYVAGVPDGHELYVMHPGGDFTIAQVPTAVGEGDTVVARAMNPQLAAARAAALKAARPMAAAANARVAYRDKTVVAPQPRTGPAPRDKTVAKTPPMVRLGAPPVAPPKPPKSPLKAAIEMDGEELPEDAITDTDLHDLDVGGGPSAADVAHAERERDAKGQ